MNTHDLGDVVRLSTVFAVNGTPTNPVTVTLRVQKPDRTTTVYVYGTDDEVVRDGPGLYHVDIAPARFGIWASRWEGVGDVTVAEEELFFVRPSRIVDGSGITPPPVEGNGTWDFSDSAQSGHLVTAGL